MILHGKLILDPREAPRPGWVRIEGERIAEIGEGKPAERPDAGDGGGYICPGFIDAHLHLPQIGAIGRDGLDLLQWLERVIYPAEQGWADPQRAREQIDRVYNRMLRTGTLGYAGYLTSHRHGLVEVIRAGHRRPLRAVVGQVLMDRNAPDDLLGQPLARLALSSRGRVTTSVNPRFAVSCTDRLLDQAGTRSSEGKIIQTHLAESIPECARVAELFPDDPHYTGVYDRHGLLTERTLLAHAVHLSEDEWRLITERDSVVVHCPTANTFLQSGLFDLDAALAHGVRLALGSDIAAGPDLAMPRVGRAMIEVAKMRAMTVAPSASIPTPADVWQLITRGNADALGFTDAGRLEAGAAADLLMLAPVTDDDEHLIEHLIYTWSDEYVEGCVLNGTMIDLKKGTEGLRG